MFPSRKSCLALAFSLAMSAAGAYAVEYITFENNFDGHIPDPDNQNFPAGWALTEEEGWEGFATFERDSLVHIGDARSLTLTKVKESGGAGAGSFSAYARSPAYSPANLAGNHIRISFWWCGNGVVNNWVYLEALDGDGNVLTAVDEDGVTPLSFDFGPEWYWSPANQYNLVYSRTGWSPWSNHLPWYYIDKTFRMPDNAVSVRLVMQTQAREWNGIGYQRIDKVQLHADDTPRPTPYQVNTEMTEPGLPEVVQVGAEGIEFDNVHEWWGIAPVFELTADQIWYSIGDPGLRFAHPLVGEHDITLLGSFYYSPLYNNNSWTGRIVLVQGRLPIEINCELDPVTGELASGPYGLADVVVRGGAIFADNAPRAFGNDIILDGLCNLGAAGCGRWGAVNWLDMYGNLIVTAPESRVLRELNVGADIVLRKGLSVSGAYSDPILRKTGDSTLFIDGPNTFSGSWDIKRGWLEFTKQEYVGLDTGDLTPRPDYYTYDGGGFCVQARDIVLPAGSRGFTILDGGIVFRGNGGWTGEDNFANHSAIKIAAPFHVASENGPTVTVGRDTLLHFTPSGMPTGNPFMLDVFVGAYRFDGTSTLKLAGIDRGPSYYSETEQLGEEITGYATKELVDTVRTAGPMDISLAPDSTHRVRGSVVAPGGLTIHGAGTQALDINGDFGNTVEVTDGATLLVERSTALGEGAAVKVQDSTLDLDTPIHSGKVREFCFFQYANWSFAEVDPAVWQTTYRTAPYSTLRTGTDMLYVSDAINENRWEERDVYFANRVWRERTYGAYSGQFYLGPGTNSVTFFVNFDDAKRLWIDGKLASQHGDAHTCNNDWAALKWITIQLEDDAWHTFDIAVYTNEGSGPSALDPWQNFGFGMDFAGRNVADRSYFSKVEDPGDGSFLRTDGPIPVASLDIDNGVIGLHLEDDAAPCLDISRSVRHTGKIILDIHGTGKTGVVYKVMSGAGVGSLGFADFEVVNVPEGLEPYVSKRAGEVCLSLWEEGQVPPHATMLMIK